MRTSIEIFEKMGSKENKEVIHSGHFMMSDFDAIEAQEEEEKEVEKYLVEIPDPDGEKSASEEENAQAMDPSDVVERRKKKVKFRHKNVIQYQSATSTTEKLSIDESLTKLFNAMDIAYKHKITSPKWNRFKGLKLRCKDKIRLNNVIWRCWHMQFILKKKMRVCQFALDVDMHNKPEAIVMEGKYWKRHLDTVTAEYKKWRIYYKNKLTGYDTPTHLVPDELLATFEDIDWLQGGGGCSFDDIDSYMDLSDTLFTSLMNAPEQYAFPNPREIARTGNSDLVQPGLVQLQPDLRDFAYSPKLLAGHGSEQQSLPPVPEEDFYSSEVETAGLPPPTPNTPPSYASASSSPQPSSILESFRPPSQARLTTIDNASLLPIADHHQDELQRSQDARDDAQFTRSSDDCFYPISSMTSLHSSMELPSVGIITSKSLELSHDNYHFTPCLSLVPSTPPSPSANLAPQHNATLSHPPPISTPKVFTHNYNSNGHQDHQDLLIGLPSRTAADVVTNDGQSAALGYSTEQQTSSSAMQHHHQLHQQHVLQRDVQAGLDSLMLHPPSPIMSERSHGGENIDGSQRSPDPNVSRHVMHQTRHNKSSDNKTMHEGHHNLQRVYVKNLTNQNLTTVASSSSDNCDCRTTLSHSHHPPSSASSSPSPNFRDGRRKAEFFAVPKYPKRRSSYSGVTHGNNRKPSSSQSSPSRLQPAPNQPAPNQPAPNQPPHTSLHHSSRAHLVPDVRTVTVSQAASNIQSHTEWSALSNDTLSRNPRLIAPASLPQQIFTAFVTKGEPGEQPSSATQRQDGHNSSGHLVFSNGSGNSSTSSPVKLSFVIPNISPPALIPLTTVTPFTTTEGLTSKPLQSGSGSISIAQLHQASFSAPPNTLHKLPFLSASSSNVSGSSTPLNSLAHLPGGGTAFFATPIAFSASPSGVTVAPATSTSAPCPTGARSTVPVTLPSVTLSAVTPSSLKSIPQSQVLYSSNAPSSSNSSNPLFSGPRIFKTSPPYLGPSSPIPSPPNKAFRPKNDQERVQYREHRRVCHINAEKKRRCSIKSNFETLHSLIPSITSSSNSKISKAALLHKGADYIKQLKSDREQLAQKIDLAKQELESLSAQISTAQSQLPATGAPMSHSRHNQLGQMYKDYVRDRTLNQNWKFYIFSLLGDTLLQSFNANVSTASVEDLSRSSLAWLDQHCSLNLLRPVVSSKMLQLSQQTSVLSSPQMLPEEIYHIVTKQEDRNNSNNSGGSSSNSSRSSSLVRM